MSLTSTSAVASALFLSVDTAVDQRAEIATNQRVESIIVLSEGTITPTAEQRAEIKAEIANKLFTQIYNAELQRATAILDAPAPASAD